MTYEQLKSLKPRDFKRKCGVQRETFEYIVQVLSPHLDRRSKRGGQWFPLSKNIKQNITVK